MSGPEDELPRWELLSDELSFQARVWDLRTRRYRQPLTGQEGDFYYLNSSDWAIVVARTKAGELVMIRQFRWGVDDFTWEFPGGVIDEGEDPVVAGLRELQEETGYVAQSGRLIGSCSPNPAILNNKCHVIFADQVELGETGTDWDEHEEIEVRIIPEAEVMDWARNNRIGHALAMMGLLYYQLNK
ncbi:NUDIX hydrolase [Coraliomargarita parva]|uniref:NUDIX hydrolase n=1 Tax=Coraliomargarita parva TaxID=3014050 RepID=UPI0022B4E31E|nr:NUDIX hydrolase [Coraliomargarita parva]